MPSETWIQRRPSVEVWSTSLDYMGAHPAVTSLLLDWGNGACRPVLDRAEFLARVLRWDDFRVR